MRLTVACAGVLFSTVLVVGPVTGDENQLLAPGTLCRVTAPTLSASPLVGTLAESSDRELILVAPDIGKRTIPFDTVTKVEWSAGRRNRVGEFALGGALLGLVVGAIGGATSGGDCKGAEGSCAAMGAVTGTVGWGAVGALVGTFVKSYRWKEVPLPGAHVSVVPMIGPGSRAGVAVALRW